MMVATPNLDGDDEMEEEEYTDEEIEDEEELDEEEYSDEFEPEIESNLVPHSFEEFQNMYRSLPEEAVPEVKRTSKVTFIEPQSVEREIESEVEQQIFNMPAIDQDHLEGSPQYSPDELDDDDYEPDIDLDMGEEEIEEEEEPSGKLIVREKNEIIYEIIEFVGEELIDEDDINYDESDENLSDIDDSELLKRLEAKYGKIEDEKAENEEHDDASWTSK
jgi:hypothetical protein